MALSTHICPWWLAFALDNPVRRFIHNPEKILSEHIKRGDIVLDIGCGTGVFSIPMAKMVGESGFVIAVDLQDEMLQILRKKAIKEGLESRIVAHKSDPDRIGITDRVDFALAFYMVHEVPNALKFLKEVASMLKPKGKLLIVEPKGHVSAFSFKKTSEAAKMAGLMPISSPKIRFSRSMLFQLNVSEKR